MAPPDERAPEQLPAPVPPPAARQVFGEMLPRAAAYADLLAREATVRGLIGPREVPRLWERHLLNCAVLAELLPPGARVCDLGSGAGLPGIPLAIRRPDLQVVLLEPLLRRTRFLDEVVPLLDLPQVAVRRARAQELAEEVAGERAGEERFDVVVSRAVAPLERLARWSLPLVRPGGAMLAMKGSSAAEELAQAHVVLRRLGGEDAEIVHAGGDVLATPVTAVRVRKAAADGPFREGG